MKALASCLALALIFGGVTSAQAKDSPKSNSNSAQILKNGLNAMVASAANAGPPAKTIDKD